MAVRKFSLCTKCASRQGDLITIEVTDVKRCFICRGLMAKTESIGQRALARLDPYQFRTFSVGMIIPADVQEREDKVRSELQIRGNETIKSQISRDIAALISRRTGKNVDRANPEVTLLVDVTNGILKPMAKSLFVYGRYTKPRGVSQRKEICEHCGGKGCDRCEGGYSTGSSIERTLGKRLVHVFGATDVKFTWLGSEDSDSLVYKPGRPFVAEVRGPRRRKSPGRLTVVTGNGYSRISRLKILPGRPISLPSFTFKTEAVIEPVEGAPEDLRPSKRIAGVLIEYRNNKGKAIMRKVHAIVLRRKGKTLVARIKMDGGLPVKRLVSGESTSPSLSEVLKTPLRCQRFDILRVWESGSFEFG